MNYLFFVEGETEQSLVKKQFHGKVEVLNLWNANLKKIQAKIQRLSPRDTYLFIVFDTDELGNVLNFIGTINSLKTHCKELFILQQMRNFEDELCHACQCKMTELFAMFAADGKNYFKQRFIASSDCLSQLKKQGFSLERLWARRLIDELDCLKKNRADGKSLGTIRQLVRIPPEYPPL